MDIGFYIADLLRKQEKVSLPGLGTFVRHKIPASYSQISNIFLPPSFEVSFSNEILESDSLSEYISVKKKLSPSSAEYFVKKFTSGILDIIKTSGIAELTPLGIIRQKNDTLTFEMSADFRIAGKFYGLKPVSDIRTLVQPAAQDVAAATTPKGDFIEDFITGQEAEEEFTDDEVYESPRRGSRTLLVILGAFLFAIITGGLIYVFNPTTKNMIDRMFPQYVSDTPVPDSGNVPRISPVAKPDSLKTVPSIIAQDSSIIDSANTLEPIRQESEREAGISKIEIIGAAFGKRSEAESYVSIMNRRGIKAKIAEDMPGKLFKVSLGSFSDYQSAQNELNRIVQEVEKTAWIAKYKSKKTQ